MQKIREELENLKKPIETFLRNPEAGDTLTSLEKTAFQTVERLQSGNIFRFSAEVLLFDLKNELRGFERFDKANKIEILKGVCRIIEQLEALADREENLILRESEIAEDMKAQAAKDLEKMRAREASNRRQAPRPNRPVPGTRRPLPVSSPNDRNPASPAAKPNPPAANAASKNEQEEKRPSSRRRRRPRRRGGPKPTTPKA